MFAEKEMNKSVPLRIARRAAGRFSFAGDNALRLGHDLRGLRGCNGGRRHVASIGC